MMEMLEDQELIKTIKNRKGQKTIKVAWKEL